MKLEYLSGFDRGPHSSREMTQAKSRYSWSFWSGWRKIWANQVIGDLMSVNFSLTGIWLVRSNFCFWSQSWAPQSIISNLFLVENIQRRATHFILGNSNLCYKDRLIKLKLLPLSYWLEYLDLVLFLNCLHERACRLDFTREFRYYFSFLKHTPCFIRANVLL